MVRSGVTKAALMARPASISSAAMTMSTSPGAGISARTGVRPRLRHHLEIVDGGAGALRDARHRGRLRVPAVALGEIDDPVGEHAAALPADREDGELDDAAIVRQTCTQSWRKRQAPRLAARCSQPITARRTPSRKRSQPFGLWMMSAR